MDTIALHDVMAILRPVFANPEICKVTLFIYELINGYVYYLIYKMQAGNSALYQKGISQPTLVVHSAYQNS